MNSTGASVLQSRSQAVKLPLILIIITVVLSLLYGIQHYAGGPIQLAVVSELYDMVLSPNNSLVAAGAHDGTVRVWDTRNGWAAYTLSGHSGPVVGVAFTPDNSTLISAGHDGTVRLWNVSAVLNAGASSKQEGQVLDAGGEPLNDMALATDGSILATVGADGVVRVFDVALGQMLQSIGLNENAKLAVALSSDGALVAADDGVNIQLWDTHTGDPIRTLAGYCEEDETKATREECEEADEEWLGHKKEVTALAFSPDGTLLASGSADTTIIFWEVETGAVKWPSAGHWSEVSRMVFHPDGNAMLSGGRDNKIRNWRLPGGKSTAYYEGHLSAVNGVAFGWDAETILTAGEDGTVRVWETANQKTTYIEWTRHGLQPVWGKLLRDWMLVSALIGLVGLWGLWKAQPWGHLLVLALYVLGPIIVLGLPLLEVLTYPLSLGVQLQIAWPLLALAVWYTAVVITLMRESVAIVYEAPQSLSLSERLTTGQRTVKMRVGIFVAAVWFLVLVILYSVLRRFNLDVAFMGHFFSFIMEGSWITFRVSALSIILAVVLALLGALGRLSRNPIANGVSGFYISLIRGTPLLVQVYIWYLGLPRVGIVLPGEVAGIMALGVNYGAYMTEIFRAGIQAIGKGQHEAAEALGMSRTQLYRRIVLPQAFRIVIPPIGNQFIAMMKDSSLVSLMSIWELSYRAQKIGRQYFRSLETFIIAAAFYWILTVMFQLLRGKLEDYMARGERR
ncbi:MAG: ABC transporter permease subunit [Anaerolineae bacterium]